MLEHPLRHMDIQVWILLSTQGKLRAYKWACHIFLSPRPDLELIWLLFFIVDPSVLIYDYKLFQDLILKDNPNVKYPGLLSIIC